jgi:hypothetical protein
MRVLIAMAFLALPLAAQQPANIYAAGISYSPAASPKIAGTALYARSISDSQYVFTIFDALPTTQPPYTVTTQVGGGIAQRVATIKGVPLYVPTSAGISWTGTNTGWAWTTGGMASIHIRDGWRIFPNVRVLKSSIGTGYQWTAGVLFGRGQ